MRNQRKIGAVLSYVGLVINAVGAFIYVPLLLGFLTTSQYGVYELIGSVIAYLSIMDAGLSTTLNRYYVKEKVANGEVAVENLLAMAAILYAVITVLAVLVGFGANALLPVFFSSSFSPAELELAHQMMILVIINCLVIFPGNWFFALINANERFIFARLLAILKYVFQFVCIVLVLNVHSSAVLVLVVQVVVNLLYVAVCALYVLKRLKVCVRFHSWNWALLRSLLSFSFLILLTVIFNQIFWKTGQIVLGAVSGATAVAVYGIVSKLVNSGYMQVSMGVTSVFLPKLTAISARTNDMSEINALFNRIGRIQAILVFGMLAAFVAIGRDFVFVWVGSEFGVVYPAVLVLMFGLVASLVQNLGISVLQAKNKMAFRSAVYLILAALYVIVSIPAATYFGVYGVAAAAAIILFIGTGPVINVYYHRVIGIDVIAFWKQVSPLALPAIITSFSCSFIFSVVPLEVSWISVGIESLLFVVLYGLLLWAFWMNDYEKGIVLSMLRRLRLVS